MYQAEVETERAPELPWWRRQPRRLGLVVGLPCWLVLAVAAWLHPDPRGYDTHTQLHLPPCGFLQRTGMPCPTCGMTTAFAQMAHGRPLEALRVQPTGTLLFGLAALAALISLAQVASGRQILAAVPMQTWWLWALLGGILAGWAINLLAGWASGRFPVR